ncbi:unnamed protein product [Acanthoscelides obtectus]|uniref:C2H2-type domain-containing protein n=1 Tax=Acanthoscelides obtectus TaxID=200917 RepID=A0A9P0QIL6_ACAOB|nr:unnamed protein product [Acanthoscelides obtectus]CAH2020886.1 unnamed protein product [Acanthoscelides obtectus]CAK1684479.1 hypothetical protein AOBTE_LOCUS34873 [Acanthoscelides obtectus]CAK1684481.1 hypothetical protein AOBTE_LOCUS34875 [Acanthoscelides obtectus]
MFQCPKCQRTFAVRKSLLRHCRARCSQDEEPASKRPCNATAPRSTADKWECPRCRQKFSARKGLLRHGREVCTSEKSPPEQQRVEASITQTTTGLNTRRLDPSTANVAIPGPSRMSPTTSNDSQTSAESRTIRCDSCNCEVPRNAHAAHLKSIKHKAHLWTPLHNNVSHQYSNKVSLAYTDTDSLIVHVETDNFYEDMKSHVHYFDTSNYDADNPHNMPRTASELGKMKDEYGGKVLSAFYGTGPTAYCIDAVDQVAKRAKDSYYPDVLSSVITRKKYLDWVVQETLQSLKDTGCEVLSIKEFGDLLTNMHSTPSAYEQYYFYRWSNVVYLGKETVLKLFQLAPLIAYTMNMLKTQEFQDVQTKHIDVRDFIMQHISDLPHSENIRTAMELAYQYPNLKEFNKAPTLNFYSNYLS